MDDLKGKVAFITGGGSGAGLGQAKVFARAGCKVAIADVRDDHLKAAAAELRQLGATFHAVRLDVTDRTGFERAAQETEAVLGPVQLLFNTAGVGAFGPLERATFDDYDWIMGVNFGGVVNGMQTLVPRMIAYGQGGHIVNTASMAAFHAGSLGGIYSASKFAVHGITLGMRDALAKYGIGVSLLCPANINSNIAESIKTRPAHLSETSLLVDEVEIEAQKELYSQGMDPEELAGHVLAAIGRNDCYILPYPEARFSLEAAFRRVMEALPPEDADPEGVAKRRQAMQRYREARRPLGEARSAG